MFKRSVTTFLLVAVAATLALAFTDKPDAGAAATKTVKVSDDFYSRSSITIKKNDTISFKWQNTSDKHSVTSNSSPATFSSQVKKGNYSFSHKFTKTGTYSLFCKKHPDQMRLSVKVKKN